MSADKPNLTSKQDNAIVAVLSHQGIENAAKRLAWR
jgi:hypothetical protein